MRSQSRVTALSTPALASCVLNRAALVPGTSCHRRPIPLPRSRLFPSCCVRALLDLQPIVEQQASIEATGLDTGLHRRAQLREEQADRRSSLGPGAPRRSRAAGRASAPSAQLSDSELDTCSLDLLAQQSSSRASILLLQIDYSFASPG